MQFYLPYDLENQKSERFGTAFLCSLPMAFDYEVILLSVGENFAHSGGALDKGFPYSDYGLFFRNLKGNHQRVRLQTIQQRVSNIGIWQTSYLSLILM